MRISAIPILILLSFLIVGCHNTALPDDDLRALEALDSQIQQSDSTTVPNTTYEQQAANLSKAIDISIVVFREIPPKELSPQQLQTVNSSLLNLKKMVQIPEPQFRNTKSLKFLEADVFAYFQEGQGPTVDAFWRVIKESHLPYKREDMLAKILKRGKIADEIEYDFVIDGLVIFQQEGRITAEDVVQLNRMIGEFEQSGGGE